jgi:tRNA splicing endonuclease
MVLRALMNGKLKNSGSGALSNNTNIWTAKNSRNSGLRKELRNRGWIVRAGLATIQLMTVGAAKMLMRWG